MISDLLKIKRGVSAVIGGGGKTTLIHTLAKELLLQGTVIITTTTHILKSDVFCNVVTKCEADNLSYITHQLELERCLCVGSQCENSKLGAPCVSIEELSGVCDYVLVEADGSKHLPLKAHLSHEPVIPKCSTQTILLVGVDAVGGRLSDVTHRADKACELLGLKNTDIITEKAVADLINIENLHDKVVINKCDDINAKNTAELISGYINSECIISSLLKGEWYVSSN